MCLIVDNNVAAIVFVGSGNNYKNVLPNLLSGKAKLVYGGKLLDELEGNGKVAGILRMLDQAGRTEKIARNRIDSEILNVKKMKYESDDEHVLALARVSKARILCSEDKALREDFKNKIIIDNPRGVIYSSSRNDSLFVKYCKKS